MTQAEMILADLLKGKRITPIDALRDYGCFRLGARIYDLKQEGYDIRTGTYVTERNAHVAEYWLFVDTSKQLRPLTQRAAAPVNEPISSTPTIWSIGPDGQLSLLGEMRA